MSGGPGPGGERPFWLKVLIGLAFAFAAFNLGVYLYGLTLPGEWRVEESVVIDAAPAEVYPLLESPKRWAEWTTWSKRTDSSAEFRYEGPESGKDSSVVWDGERLGAGRLTITAAEPPKSVSYSLRLGGSDFSDEGRLTLDAVETGTRVTWTDGGELGGTLGRLFGDRLERSVSSDFSASLARLKNTVERQSTPDPEEAT